MTIKQHIIFCIGFLLIISYICFSADKIKIDSNTFGAIEARSIGPAVMSGRIMAIDAVNNDPRIIYVGTASGGLWKSKNGGVTFKAIFDKYTQSIGAVAIDQSRPDTVWVGTGETCTRNSVSVGTGLYKTTDAGENWHMVGLQNTERISRIMIDPKDPDIVYVAALGHLWDANAERGVYKTTDGGKTWERILFVNNDTGAADIAIDPQEPNILYAAMWQFRRTPYSFKSGGPGSSIYKTTDGGKTWKKINKGFPGGDLGRIAIAIAPSRSSLLYAVVEAKESGFYRSDDMGENWVKLNASFNLIARPFYFSHLFVDPKDYKHVYKPGYSLSMSDDGGQSFSSPFVEGNVHGDMHAFWIDPNNPYHLLLGTDGGVYVSLDRGATWRFLGNLPVSQFYHVSYDMEQPYNVYGGLQDNGSWQGPSQGPNGIENRDWQNVGGGDGFWAFPDPNDKDIVYCEAQGGDFYRFHRGTREIKEIKPFPKENEPKFRFNWNTPMALSPTNPHTIYYGAQFLFRSNDKGESWERISSDLTTNNPEKQKQEESGGLTVDNTTAENHCTIYIIAESPLEEKVIWVGTDDGNVQVTQDSGKNWTNVVKNVPGLPATTWVSSIEIGHFEKGTAYATFDGHRTGDMKAYVYKTTDYGKTWKSLMDDSIKGYAYVLREDLVNKNLLFLGTEFGLFVSVDGGEQWAQFTGKLPNVSVQDIAIHPRESDVILATHGRGIYIIDDITPFRQITPEILNEDAHVFDLRPSTIKLPSYLQESPGDADFVGDNPAEVATITYYLKERHVMGDLKVEVYNSENKLMATLPAGKRKGINRVKWYMRMKPPKVTPSPQLEPRALFGPMVSEGIYAIKLIKGDKTYSGQIKVIPDPKYPYSAEDRALQYKTVLKLYQMQEDLGKIADSTISIRDNALAQIKKLNKNDKMSTTLKAFADKLDKFHKTLVATKEGAAITGEEKLRERVVELYSAVSNFMGKPTQSQLTRLSVLEKEIASADDVFKSITEKDLPSINESLKSRKLSPLLI